MDTKQSKKSNRPSLFISYSHADEIWKNRVVKQLRVLEFEGNFEVWDDRRINAGDDWYPAIEKALTEACVAILLISADFLTSSFIQGNEVPRLLERRKAEGIRVIPLIVWPCAWQRVAWLKGIQSRPVDGRPLAKGDEYQIRQDLADLVAEVDDLLRALLPPGEKSQQPGILSPTLTAGNLPPSPQQEPRLLVVDLLNRLMPTQFEAVKFRYGVPEEHIPQRVAQNEQAIAVIQYALQREGEALAQLLDTIHQVAPHLKQR